MEYDYIVNQDGTGTHRRLFGERGALAEAMRKHRSSAIFVALGHSERVTATDNISSTHTILIDGPARRSE